MDDVIVAGEPPVENAPAPDGNTEKSAAEMLAEKDAELARLSEERDNYRKAALKAKGKLKEEEDDEDGTPSLEDIIDRKVEEKLFDRQADAIRKDRETLLQKTLKENEEMRNALRNRPGSGSGGGSNADKPTPVAKYWSPEQEADLKAKGLDPQEVWDNMPKPGQTGGISQ